MMDSSGNMMHLVGLDSGHSCRKSCLAHRIDSLLEGHRIRLVLRAAAAAAAAMMQMHRILPSYEEKAFRDYPLVRGSHHCTGLHSSLVGKIHLNAVKDPRSQTLIVLVLCWMDSSQSSWCHLVYAIQVATDHACRLTCRIETLTIIDGCPINALD